MDTTAQLWIGRDKKRGACRARSPKEIIENAGLADGIGGRLGRLRLDAPGPAAERLHPELGQLLRPDAVVLLDHDPHGVRQALTLGDDLPELLRRLLLARREGGLLRVDALRPGEQPRELD